MRYFKQIFLQFSKLIFYVIISYISYSDVIAQNKNIRFQHFTINDGLPQNMVDCILEDRKGFMWFGTWNGICRYDGYTFKEFKDDYQNIGKKLNNFIYSSAEDDYGNIWIGTNDGLSVFIYNKGKYKHFKNFNKDWPLLSGKINSVVRSKSGSIWIGGKQGIAEFNPINENADIKLINQFEFGKSKYNLLGNDVLFIMQSRLGNLWVGTNLGIHILNENRREFKRILNITDNPNSIPNNSIHAIFEDSDGLIWIGTENGVSMYNTETEIFRNFFHSPFAEFSLVHNSITAIAEDINGNIVVGTLGGVSIYNKKNSGIFSNYNNQFYSEFGLNNDFINCIYVDKRGNVWIGTERGGINKYNANQTEFEYFEKEANNPNSLSWNTINSILEDEQYIWIGTAGGGLNRYSKKLKKYTHIVHSPSNLRSLSSNFVTSLCKDKSGNLWVGTWGGGLCKLINEDSPTPLFENFTEGNTQENALVNNFISSLQFDKDDNLWIGTYGGLDKFNYRTSLFEHYMNEQWKINIKQIGCLAFDKKENLWVGTQFGLYKLIADTHGKINFANPNVHYFNHHENKANSLNGDYVISLLFDINGKLWIGTYGDGLSLLLTEENTGTFKNYTMADGLPNNIIYTITEDNQGNIWLTTDHGLSRYDIKQEHFRNFYASDGLQNNQYYWSAAFKNSDGKLYFGGMNGVNTFFPEWIIERTYHPKVIFTDFKIFNESVRIDEKYNGKIVLTNSISETKEISISYKSNEFLFEFSALDFEKSNSNEYAYMLEGFDKGWNNIGSNRRFVSYTNLLPDNYVFKVRATNSKGEWTQIPTSIKITIIPPFWQTWWFRIVVFAAIVSLIIGYNRYRIYSLRLQKKKLIVQVKERTLEIENQNIKLAEQNKKLAHTKELIEGQKQKLEIQNEEILNQRDELIKLNKKVNLVNQYKLRFFTNVSHEFRTPLTLILGPIEKLLQNTTFDEEVKNTLQLINRNANRLLHLISQLMDFRKIEKGKMELKISRVNIIEFTNDIVSAFKDLAKQKNIELKLDILIDKLDEAWFDPQKIENILYNLLSNAFKYTKENGKIWIKVYLKNHPDTPEIVKHLLIEPIDKTVVFEVGDSGTGIKEENISLIFQRFYRSIEHENITIGSGIGLSLTRELIKTHGGKIRVSSELGKGSVFYIAFPISKTNYKEEDFVDAEYNTTNLQNQVDNLFNEFLNQEKLDQNENKHKLKFIKNRPNILVAEDNRDLREFLAIKLNENYNILEAEDGKIAYDIAIVQNPTMIITDIMMPEMDGIKLCQLIKQTITTSHIPVIMLSSKSSVESSIEGFESGADDYLPKPFNFSLLEVRIQNLIESRKKLLSIFTAKIDLEPTEITSNKIDEQFLRKVIDLIENNLDDPNFGVSNLITELNMSRSTLHKKFIALTNQSSVDFINNIKLKKSVALLKNLNLNISEVAYSAGFNDPKYYSRIFKKFFGLTPTEYQKELSEL